MAVSNVTMLLRYVGLCKRAGGTLRGAELIEKALRKNPPPVCVILASDASDRTVGQIAGKCSAAKVPCRTVPADKYTLAHTVGASSPCAALAILPGRGPAGEVLRLLETAEKSGEEEN